MSRFHSALAYKSNNAIKRSQWKILKQVNVTQKEITQKTVHSWQIVHAGDFNDRK